MMYQMALGTTLPAHRCSLPQGAHSFFNNDFPLFHDQKMKIHDVLAQHIFPNKLCTTYECIPELQNVECGPMPNVMAALPNIGGTLYSTPQSLAHAHY